MDNLLAKDALLDTFNLWEEDNLSTKDKMAGTKNVLLEVS